MIETMAGKSACLNGVVYDATPFTYSEDNPAVNYFGNLLKQCNCDIWHFLFVQYSQCHLYSAFSREYTRLQVLDAKTAGETFQIG